MKVYVTRHGNTNYNQLRLCNADPSVVVHLTDLGKQQLEQVATGLRSKKLQTIFISPLSRTKESADIVNKYHDVSYIVDDRITDNNTGFEGKTVDEYHAAFSQVQDTWAFKPEGAESLYDVRDRVTAFLRDLVSQDFDTVLIVTHQSIIRQIFGVFGNLNREEINKVELPQGKYAEFDI